MSMEKGAIMEDVLTKKVILYNGAIKANQQY